MNSPRTAERKQIVMIGTGVAAASAATVSLIKPFPWIVWPYGVFLLGTFAYVATQLVRIRRRQRARRKGTALGKEGRA